MYQATITSMTIANHVSAKLPGYESATSASRRKIAPTRDHADACGMLAVTVFVLEGDLLEHAQRFGLDRPKIAQRRAVPRYRAHQRAQPAVALVELDVQVDAALGSHHAQLAKPRYGARAVEQVVVDLVEAHAITRDRTQLDVQLAWRRQRDDAAAVDDRDAIAQLPRFVEQIGGQHHRLAGTGDEVAPDQRAQFLGMDRIDGAR